MINFNYTELSVQQANTRQQLETLPRDQLIQMLMQKNITNIQYVSNTYTGDVSMVQGNAYNISESTIHGDLKVSSHEPEPQIPVEPKTNLSGKFDAKY